MLRQQHRFQEKVRKRNFLAKRTLIALKTFPYISRFTWSKCCLLLTTVCRCLRNIWRSSGRHNVWLLLRKISFQKYASGISVIARWWKCVLKLLINEIWANMKGCFTSQLESSFKWPPPKIHVMCNCFSCSFPISCYFLFVRILLKWKFNYVLGRHLVIMFARICNKRFWICKWFCDELCDHFVLSCGLQPFLFNRPPLMILVLAKIIF